MATVEYQGIGKSFGSFRVMKDISLHIQDRGFVVLLGPSGCGKTTLLRMTAGLESVSEGDLLIGGRRVNGLHPRDRDIAMVFQNYALYPTMKVYDNIAFSLQVAKQSPEEIKKKVHWAAETLNLTPFLDRYPKALSGGQRQRVAMGRAMVREAQVFLFDEPLSNLDAKLRAHMRMEIRQLHNRLGTTTIYVTHDQIEAMTMADTIVLMQGGRIEQIGTPDEVYDRPANRYVADFIGSPGMNFLEGVVEAANGAPVCRAGEAIIPLPKSTGARQGQNVVCGLRPGEVRLDPNGPIVGRAIIAEPTGPEVQLYAEVAGQRFVALVPKGNAFEEGDPLRFSIEPERVHLFDAKSEARV